MPEDATKDKLKQIEEQLGEARDQRAVALKARDEARDAFAAAKSMSQDSREFKTAQKATEHLAGLDETIANLRAMQVGTLKMLGKDAPAPEGQGAAGDPTDPRGAWSMGNVLADDGLRLRLEAMASTTMPAGRMSLGQIASRDAVAAAFGTPMAADVAGTPNMRRGTYLGPVPQLRRRLSVLDLLPVGKMDNNSLPYTKESGSFSTARETAEGDAKPEAAVTYTDANADAATIAHWLKQRKQVLADLPALQSIIEGRLRYGVELRLEDEVLAGDGAGENMLGILNTSGIGAVAFDGAELVADQVLKGITTVLLANAEANGIVMNPLDWQRALIAKAAGDGHYYSGGPFSVTPQTMWGIPLLSSNAIAEGMALVGDFALGAQLFIRQGVEVLISDSDQDDFTKNKVTLLAEMRAALAVFRPAAFCGVDLAA